MDGLRQNPDLRDYSSNNLLYRNISKSCGFSRNRFEVFLHCFHISDNEYIPQNDRLFKTSSLITLMNSKLKKKMVSFVKESVYIDETGS